MATFYAKFFIYAVFLYVDVYCSNRKMEPFWKLLGRELYMKESVKLFDMMMASLHLVLLKLTFLSYLKLTMYH